MARAQLRADDAWILASCILSKSDVYFTDHKKITLIVTLSGYTLGSNYPTL